MSTTGIIAASRLRTSKEQLFLNSYPNAIAAFSTQRISNKYSGDCIEVRRASDNTTQNIGFEDNSLDVTALEVFCAGTDGYVRSWFDQTGNNKTAIQLDDIRQPKIVTNGSVILKDGIPALSGDGVNDFMDIINCENIFKTEFSAFSIFAYKVKGNEQRFYAYNNNGTSGSTDNYFLMLRSNDNIDFITAQGTPSFGAIKVSITDSQDLVRIIFSQSGKSNDAIKGKINGSTIASASINNFEGVSSNNYRFKLFSSRAGTINAEMLAQAFIFYEEDKTVDLNEIELRLKLDFNIL